MIDKHASSSEQTGMSSNLGFHYLIVYGVDIKEWCEYYDIEPFVVQCSSCSTDLHVKIPFAAKNRRGLLANQCSCGNSEVLFSYVDLNHDSINLNSLCKLTEISTDEVSEGKDLKVHPNLKLVDTFCD